MNESSTPEASPAAGTTPAAGAGRTASPGRRGALLAGVARNVAQVVAGALDLVFPPACLSCHGLVEAPSSNGESAAGLSLRNLCESCRRRLVLVQAPHCTTCGHPFFGVMQENIGCSHCETLRPEFGEGRTATLLQGPMRSLVHAFKYDGARHVWGDITAIIRAHAHFHEFLAGAVLVPVPLHSRKLRERGYNQAQVLAELIVDQVPGATVQPLLRRVVDTPTQTHLDRQQRRDNLKNAFALAAGAPIKPALRHVLVDDVFTTGATLNACAQVLRRAGLTRVDVATLGHG